MQWLYYKVEKKEELVSTVGREISLSYDWKKIVTFIQPGRFGFDRIQLYYIIEYYTSKKGYVMLWAVQW